MHRYPGRDRYGHTDRHGYTGIYIGVQRYPGRDTQIARGTQAIRHGFIGTQV